MNHIIKNADERFIDSTTNEKKYRDIEVELYDGSISLFCEEKIIEFENDYSESSKSDEIMIDPARIPVLIDALKTCYDEWKATLKFESADKLFQDCAVIAPILF